MVNSTWISTDYADDWRGECITCGHVVSECDAPCQVCGRVGTLTYLRENHSSRDGEWMRSWHDCQWRCEHCGARTKTLLCPKGDNVVTLARVAALLPSPSPIREFFVGAAETGVASLLFVLGFATGHPFFAVAGIALASWWCSFAKSRLARFKTRQVWQSHWT